MNQFFQIIYYRPSKDQKFYELIYVGGGMAIVSFIAAKFL